MNPKSKGPGHIQTANDSSLPPRPQTLPSLLFLWKIHRHKLLRILKTIEPSGPDSKDRPLSSEISPQSGVWLFVRPFSPAGSNRWSKPFPAETGRRPGKRHSEKKTSGVAFFEGNARQISATGTAPDKQCERQATRLAFRFFGQPAKGSPPHWSVLHSQQTG